MTVRNPSILLRVLAAGALWIGASCAELEAGRAWNRAQAVPTRGPEPSSVQDPLETIARYEDVRSDGDGLLQTLLARGSEGTRVRAAIALGRFPFPEHGPEVTGALAAALRDESAQVRAAAAFAIGMRADPAATDALLASASEAEEEVRARVVEAASRLDDPRSRGLVLQALGDPSAIVRAEAAVGPHRWKKDAPDAATVDDALLAALEKDAGGEVAWRAYSSLARRGSARARAAFEGGLSASDVRARIFSAQGLRSLPAEPESRDRLRTALADGDWRVVCEAAFALGEHPDPESLPDLARAQRHASAHVRRVVAEALGGFQPARDEARPLLERARTDESWNVRGAALVSQARLFGDAFAAEVASMAEQDDARLRAVSAAAAARLSDAAAVPILVRLSRDRNPRVADVAARGLEDHPTPDARARIAELLQAPDNGLRLAAAEILKEIGGPGDLAALEECLESSQGEIAAEVAANVVDAAARIGGERAKDILERGTVHSDPFVRKKSKALLAKAFPTARVTAATPPPWKRPPVPIPGVDYPTTGPNPRVEVVTSRGSMVFELFRDEAPVHVYSFLEIVRRGSYDGLSIHRVVPDFVIQGGDPRGDGNGGAAWHGGSLRAEFTPRKFVRGSLGMPRNDDPGSGGSQIFVTHRETPHLDGRYTLFGELRDGFDVLDAIEVDDTIRTVRVLADPGAR